MYLSELHHKIGVVAALSGMIQGLTWTVLALIAIILHYSPPNFGELKSYGEIISYATFSLFLNKDHEVSKSNVIRPKDFIVFMFFYLFLSAIWCALSTAQLLELIHIKKRQRKVMVAYGLLTLAISILDLIFWGLLLRNYLDCNDILPKDSQYQCFVPTGVVMTLSIRGYTLWVINLCFSYMMIWICVKDKFSEEHWTKRNVGSIPRIKLQDDISTKRGESPMYPTTSKASHDDGGRYRSDSPIFADDYPSFFDRKDNNPPATHQMGGHPSSSSPGRRQPSFLNRSYEHDHQRAAAGHRGAAAGAYGDRGHRFAY